MGFDGHIDIDKASLRGVMKSLDDLLPQFRKSAERAVLRAGAKPILKAAKAKVPVNTGLLKKSLGVSVKANRDGWMSARVGPRKGFKSKNKSGRKRGQAKGKTADAQEISWYVETGTPRARAQPFIRPAIDQAAGEVIDAMAAGLDQHLTRVAARLAKK